jgi:crotonobetainyl-CoA:carnitine CoA-transferase CaiB-like acyl-CoA transferase
MDTADVLEGTPEPLLAGLRIVDCADEKGELCGRFLADLGADVIRVEPPGGARSRRLPPFHEGKSLFFAARNANKRGVELDVEQEDDRERLMALLESADVWIETTRPGTLAALGLGADEVLARNPALVITSITDFGQSGDYRDWAANDCLHVAMSGVLSRSGLAGREPLLPPRGMGYETTAIQAAWATLVAYWNRLETGRGDHLDFSILEATRQTMDPAYGVASVTVSAFTAPHGRPEPGRYPIFRCADGYVRLMVATARHWRALRAWLGDPPALQDERYDSVIVRAEASAELFKVYAAFFGDKAMLALCEEAQLRGVPLGPVLSVSQALRASHFAARGTFVDTEVAPGVTARMPNGCLEVDGTRAGFRHRAPELGEHQALLAANPGERVTPAVTNDAPAATNGKASAGPLAGVRIADFGAIIIGNEIGRLFADQGAEVIKLENREFPDQTRGGGTGAEMTPSFAAGSRNKKSFGIDVRTPEGNAVVKQLIAKSDIVIDNFKPGTLEKLGLGRDELHKLRPDLLTLSTNAVGSSGPWKTWAGYGPHVRGISGLALLWRYPDDDLGFGDHITAYPDHFGARVCATATLAALIRRRRSGAGASLESAQAEIIMNQLADVFLAVSLGHLEVGEPQGNHSEFGSPWSVYPCAGNDEWCVITVGDDEGWLRLREVMGDPEWAAAPELAKAEGRIANRQELDARVAAWTAGRGPRELMEKLQAAGVPAAMMMRPPGDHEEDPHLQARSIYREIEQPGLGTVRMDDGPFRARGLAPISIGPAPYSGEHTRELCLELLGMTDAEVDALVVVGALQEFTNDTGAHVT